MNRIILVGNGFDLAHGLPTHYSDFIEWYWRLWGDRLIHGKDSIESDELCSFKLKDTLGINMWYMVWQGWYYKRENPFITWDPQEAIDLVKQDENLCDINYLSSFFFEICQSVETKGWVDIENEFYDRLSHTGSQAKSLNDDLDIIKKYLIEYLSRVQIGVKRNMINNDLLCKMNEPFVERDIALDWLHNQNVVIGFDNAKSSKKAYIPKRIMLLNFNYTDFADRYLSDIPDTTIIHIHGSLSKPDSVIFGYGDELDEHYKEILNKNDNEYLRHIKSIRYLESPNYRNLLEFIESSPYQIYIMGHSCGNSDRTLLNTLFEHKNCASIKPFYHKKDDGSDNYIELAQNITRNFTDMKLLRARVVNKDFCEMLPQNNQVQFRLY